VIHYKGSSGSTYYCCGSNTYRYSTQICCGCGYRYLNSLAEASAADKDDKDEPSESLPDPESDVTEAPANDEGEPDKDGPSESFPDQESDVTGAPDVTEAPVDDKDEPDKDKPFNPDKELHDPAPKADGDKP